jgi:hypothetical protein
MLKYMNTVFSPLIAQTFSAEHRKPKRTKDPRANARFSTKGDGKINPPGAYLIPRGNQTKDKNKRRSPVGAHGATEPTPKKKNARERRVAALSQSRLFAIDSRCALGRAPEMPFR